MTIILQDIMRGKKCWYVSAGGSTVPTFLLVLGKKIPRDRPLKNTKHPLEFQQYRGAVELLVWCSWRLQNKSDGLASSDQGEIGTCKLDQLINSKVVSVSCDSPCWDLSITFSNGLVLSIFCDHIEPNASFAHNWEFWSPKGYIKAGPGCIWEEEI